MRLTCLVREKLSFPAPDCHARKKNLSFPARPGISLFLSIPFGLGILFLRLLGFNH